MKIAHRFFGIGFSIAIMIAIVVSESRSDCKEIFGSGKMHMNKKAGAFRTS